MKELQIQKVHAEVLHLRAKHDIAILQSLQGMSSSQVMLLLQNFVKVWVSILEELHGDRAEEAMRAERTGSSCVRSRWCGGGGGAAAGAVVVVVAVACFVRLVGLGLVILCASAHTAGTVDATTPACKIIRWLGAGVAGTV